MTTTKFADAVCALEASSVDPHAIRSAFESILAGEWTAVQVGAFAFALRLRGETAEMLVAAAEAMRAAMITVEHTHDRVVDTCGTGGDGAHTLNVSTAAALVVAGAGHVVAKHGNRSVSSLCGSADVVEALGIPLDISPSEQAILLQKAGIAFLLAPAHHPALKHAAAARRELGVRTLFNALGPLLNPARATHQLVGVYEDRLRPIMAHALGKLGVQRAWVVRSEDGLDEVSPAAVTRVSELADGTVRELQIRPEDFGVARGEIRAIAGSDAAGNAAGITGILAGDAHPARLAVLLNTAAALHVVEPWMNLQACFARAQDAIDSGAALDRLNRWRAAVAKLPSRAAP